MKCPRCNSRLKIVGSGLRRCTAQVARGPVCGNVTRI